jgi:protein XagA
VPPGAKSFLIILAALSAQPATAGALLMEEGAGEIIVTSTFAGANKAYDRHGHLIRTPSYGKFEAAGYVEYGATNWLTVIAEGDAFSFNGAATGFSFEPAAHYAGAGLGALGGRIRLGEFAGVYFGAQASLRVASHSAERFLDFNAPTQIDLRLQAFRGFEAFGLPCFIDAQLGYRSRGQSGDEIHVDMTLGLRPRPDVLLLAQSFSAFAPGVQAAGGYAAQKFELSGIYDLNRDWSVQIGAVAAPTGVNAPDEKGVLAALWRRF